MKIVQIILGAMGTFYVLLGGGIAAAFALAGMPAQGIAIPLIFVLIGIGMLVGITIPVINSRRIITKGTRYPAKIYGYVENKGFTVNGSFTLNTKVHYFDESGTEREAVIPTSSVSGTNSKFPIGMTIDIYEYNGKYGYDPKSVRYEVLPREKELMDDKPIAPEERKIVAMACPNCGATFEALAGYSNKCPFCDSYLNA